jgi:hypothetical protein
LTEKEGFCGERGFSIRCSAVRIVVFDVEYVNGTTFLRGGKGLVSLSEGTVIVNIFDYLVGR